MATKDAMQPVEAVEKVAGHEKLAEAAKAVLAQLVVPTLEGITGVRLGTTPMTLRLGTTDRTMQSDGTFAVSDGTTYLAFCLQAEASTGGNVSALLGKGILSALVAQNVHVEIVVEGEVPARKPGAGRPPTNPVDRQVAVAELHTIYLVEAGKETVKACVDGVRAFIGGSGLPGAGHSILIEVRLDRPDDAAKLLNDYILTSATAWLAKRKTVAEEPGEPELPRVEEGRE